MNAPVAELYCLYNNFTSAVMCKVIIMEDVAIEECCQVMNIDLSSLEKWNNKWMKEWYSANLRNKSLLFQLQYFCAIKRKQLLSLVCCIIPWSIIMIMSKNKHDMQEYQRQITMTAAKIFEQSAVDKHKVNLLSKRMH